jgi:tripartite-type tricarboxylate transporter receptor subunit TctC
MHNFTKLVVVVTGLFATPACAEEWPSHLIKATIPFGAGSAADVVPRLVFDRLAAELGQPIVIENRAGAGGMLGTVQVAKADPDGYAVLANSSALTIAPAIFSNLAFDPTDLVSVLMIGSSANVMIVPNSRPWKTIQDFIADAKAKPGTISFGSVRSASAAPCISARRNSASPPASRPRMCPIAAARKSSLTSSAAASISISVRSRPRFP